MGPHAGRGKGHGKGQRPDRDGGCQGCSAEGIEQDKAWPVHSAVVIGGGVSGMSAAMALGNMGYEVDLVEKQDRLGGLLNDLNLVLPAHEPPSILVNDLTARLESNPKVNIHTLSEVKKVEGYVGNFIVTLSENETEINIKAGVIVVAVGARVLKPEGLFGYDGEKVITHLELEAMLKQGISRAKECGYDPVRRLPM